MGAGQSTSYGLVKTYAGASFFDGFNFMNHWDYTHGFVTYVDRNTAQNSGLISAKDGQPVYIGVDYKNKYDGTKNFWEVNGVGRPSVRIESKDAYTQGLFILDLNHMPGGVCGTWPAFWTVGPNWPNSGEIDIIEQVHMESYNQAALHTGNTCSAPGAGSLQSGRTVATDCNYNNGNFNGAGCGVQSTDNLSFGSGFNSNGGGVYAMEWTSSSIKTWFFRRGAIPSDITSGSPVPANWGKPFADFTGNCNVDSLFKNHNIILDVTFCGDWAGNTWNQYCAGYTKQPSCSVYVGDNPAAFRDMYWSINSLKVYKQGAVSSTTTTTTTTRTTTTTTTTTTSKTTTTTTTTTTSKTTTTTTRPTTTTTTTTTTRPTTTTTTTKPPTTTTTTTTTKPPTTTTQPTTSPSVSATTTTTSVRKTDVPASPSSYPAGAAPYKYAGCYTDITTGARLLTQESSTSSGMTVIVCRNFCNAKSYKYFAITNGNQCTCGNTRASSTVKAQSGGLVLNSDCKTVCPADSTQICGGPDRATLYVLS